MAESNMLADRDEDFNTRYGSFRGWQMAIERVKPIPRHTARLNLSAMVRSEGLETTSEVIDYFIARFMSVAAYAAPNPLSMLTVTTPGEQAVSEDSSAASPSKLAPYPTDVGIETTGRDNRPASTDGSAASIPATVITTRASQEERRACLDAGADAFLDKSKFREGALLETMRRLLG